MKTPQKSMLAILRDARALLEKRGWEPVASTPGIAPFGPKDGPLTLNRALWCAGCEEGRVNVQGIGGACKVLCVVGRLSNEADFVLLGEWARQQDEATVLLLLDQAIEQLKAAAVDFAARLEAMMAGDERVTP